MSISPTNKSKKSLVSRTIRSLAAANRKVYIMRHGERVDVIFDKWIPDCYDIYNNYQRIDLNMPVDLPKRKNRPHSWRNDSPLTNIGECQARLVGEGLRHQDITFDYVFSSPSYRCIQTCSNVLEGLQKKDELPINIEPGFFEWLEWYFAGLPDWLNTDELIAADFNINLHYRPVVDRKTLQTHFKETVKEFFNRNYIVLYKILKKTTGNILIVAHSITLSACTFQFVHHERRPSIEYLNNLKRIPYCGIAAMENVGKKWKFIDTIGLAITHSRNSKFNWQKLAYY